MSEVKSAVIILIPITLVQPFGQKVDNDTVIHFCEESRLLDSRVEGASLDEWVKRTLLDVENCICLLARAKHEREIVHIEIWERQLE